MLKNFTELIDEVNNYPVKKLAVAAGGEQSVIESVKDALEQNIAIPVLVGDTAEIRKLSDQVGLKLTDDMIINEPDDLKAAAIAVKLVREGTCDVLMKGMIHTDDFLRAILDKECGLRCGSIMSHVFVLEMKDQNRFVFVSDGAMNIAPDLLQKAAIILNAVYLSQVFGFERPKVAVLSAVELVNPAMPSTTDAAILGKMSDRKQFPECIIDGPLALDNVVSEMAAKRKKIESPVAGNADIWIVPNIESGNMLVKCFSFICGGMTAGVLVGASAPVVLTSRADSAESKRLSIATAVLMSSLSRTGRLKIGKVQY